MNARVVDTEFVFDRLQAAELSAAYRVLVPNARRAACGPVRERVPTMSSNAAIYARVSSARQKEPETIRSQTAALRSHAGQLGLDVPEPWVFEDDGHSGASLVRPALERLRDLVCQVPVDVLLVYSPDRLARKYAYQALLIEEFAKAGTPGLREGPARRQPRGRAVGAVPGHDRRVRARADPRTHPPRQDPPRQGRHDQRALRRPVRLPVRAQNRATPTPSTRSAPTQVVIVAELFARYADGGVAIAELTRWMNTLEVATRTGKSRWDRSVIWGMLRNPAYAGRACFGKTMRSEQTAGLNRTARLAGRSTPRHYTVTDRAREDWLQIPVSALVDEHTWARVQRRLADNKRYASRNSRNPSLLQGNPRLRRLRLRLLPHLHQDHQQEDLLLPLPRQR